MTPSAVFVIVGTALGLVRALPQLVRLLRARDAHGVSVDTAGTSSVVSTAWAAYGILTHQGAVVAASGASAIMFALVTAAALRYGRSVRELRATPIWLLVLAIAGVVAGRHGLGVLLPASVLVANTPQLLVAWREPDLSGLSPGTWTLSVAEAAVWGSYGVLADDQSIMVYGALHLVTSATILTLCLRKSPRTTPRTTHGTTHRTKDRAAGR
jgi:uncharacterized protein with PQ loop repeat